MNKPWFVYILECEGGRLYTGVTTDVERRMSEHRDCGAARKGASFTRSFAPLQLRGWTCVSDRSEALRLEWAIKKMRRPDKLALAVDWARLGSAQSIAAAA